jgi:uroporphyrinogen decarboxylase
MTKRDRVLASVPRKALDAIPWQFDLTSAVRRGLCAYYGTDDLPAATGDHMAWAGFGGPRGFVADDPGPGLYRSEFGTVWARAPRDLSVGDWGEMVAHPLHEPSLCGYEFPDGAAPGRADGIPAVRAQYPDHFLVVGGPGLFESAWALCGFEGYLGHLVGEPTFVAELTQRLADFSCAVVAQAAGMGVDGIRFGDDWGFQDRLMVRPEVWRRLFKEAYRRIFSAARSLGIIVMMHSCGNITEILPDLIEVGVQVVHPLQPEAMDVALCRREFGRDVTFWGGLGSQSTIPLGTPEDVRREVRDRLELFRDGGYILAPAGAVPAEAPVENVVAIIEEAHRQLSCQPPPTCAEAHKTAAEGKQEQGEEGTG